MASAGARQVVFVGGEPGAGKSRLVAEAAAALQGRGASVMVGKCIDGMGAAYQPFVEPIEALLPAVVSGRLVLDCAAADVAEQVDRLRTIVGAELSGPDVSSGQQFTRQLFQACVRAVVAAAAVRPFVLVLEDLQWAGHTSLQLLRYLVQRTTGAEVLILATRRTNPPDRSGDLVGTVAALYRLDGVRRVDLGGLATEEITEFVISAGRVSARAARGPAAVLRDQTGGNPFLLHEVWRELTAAADPAGGVDLSVLAEADLRAPESVCDSVRHRLEGLPVAHRRTVETAAIIGEDFSVALLTAARSDSGGGVDAAALTYAGLEAAAALGLVEPVRGPDGGFRFPHAIARQSVLDLMTQYGRAADHARVALVLETHFPAADLRIQRLAHHYAGAQSLGHGEKAVRYLVQAADAAKAALAHQDAARFFERAAAITNDPGERDQLRLQSARSYLHASKFARAREIDEQVAATTVGVDRLRAAIGFEAASWRSAQPGERAVRLLTAALAGVPADEHPRTYIWGTAALGRAFAFSGDLAAARGHGIRAVELARRTGDDRLLATTLQIGLHDGISPELLRGKLDRAVELTELAQRSGDLRHLGPAAHYRGVVLYTTGDPTGLAAAHSDLIRMARATGQIYWEWVESCLSAMRQFLRADFAGATESIKQGANWVGCSSRAAPPMAHSGCSSSSCGGKPGDWNRSAR